MANTKTKKLVISIIILLIAAGAAFLLLNKNKSSVPKNETVSEVPIPSTNAPATENNPPEQINTQNDNQEQPINEEKRAEDGTKTDKANVKITNKLVSWGHQSANDRKIEAIIIHSTYNSLSGDPFSLSKILDIYKSYGVSPHYIIDRAGNIYQLVKVSDIAYHAGESQLPDGRTDVNAVSLGIELINSKTDSPTAAQYTALAGLVKYLKGQYPIKYVLGHNQIAPGRKDDPWNFDWSRLP